MGDVVAFPDQPGSRSNNGAIILASDVGEWLYAINFISDWIPDTAPPADVMRGFIGAVSLHEGLPVEDVIAWVEQESNWKIVT